MATMTIEDVKKELNEYISNPENAKILSAGVYAGEVQIDKYAKTITAVKGKFPAFFKIISHVVQGFGEAKWNALGEAEFKHKMLQNFRQKINYPIVADEVLNTWLAKLYVEGKKAQDQPISKEILEDLVEKITDDIDILSQTGARDDSKLAEFGYSLDGIQTQVKKATSHASYPAFKIPLEAITAVNIVDQVKSFEKQLPKKTKKKVKYIFMSEQMRMEYADQYKQEYGTTVTFTENDTIKTPLSKMEIVGLDNIDDDVMFAFVDGNFARLIDVFDKPQITSIQLQDYLLKIFMDFHLGYDFIMNHLLYVAVFDDSKRGLGDAKLNKLFYPGENLVVAETP